MQHFLLILKTLLAVILITSCSGSAELSEEKIPGPEEKRAAVSAEIEQLLEYIDENKGRINDSTVLSNPELVQSWYAEKDFRSVWSDTLSWNPISDSLVSFIKKSAGYGLFPADYHRNSINRLLVRSRDSLQALQPSLWASADIMLTDAFFRITKDIHKGKLPQDSLNMVKDSATTPAPVFYSGLMEQMVSTGALSKIIGSLEPGHEGYHALKSALKEFLKKAEFKRATYVNFSFKDSMHFLETLQQRLFELDYLPGPHEYLDSTTLHALIRKYQKENKLTASGKITEEFIQHLNWTDWEKFKQVALTMDKYKQLPDTLPSSYVWVNIPAYMLEVRERDSLVMSSKVIVGKPETSTPEIVSEISNFITYPQWTVPYSIVFKEMLPQIIKDSGYLDRQNLMVVDRNDNVVDHTQIDWTKLNKKNFPYQIRQRQGDDNSLGIMKFNFRNRHSVYLHDTNARWLFQKPVRSLSHGCVRVQRWKELAEFLVKRDTVNIKMDSVNSWLNRKEKKLVQGFGRVPIYIRYFSCEASEGRLRFYEDIYGKDRLLREKYYSKTLSL